MLHHAAVGVGGGPGSALVVIGVIKAMRCSVGLTPVNLLPVRDRGSHLQPQETLMNPELFTRVCDRCRNASVFSMQQAVKVMFFVCVGGVVGIQERRQRRG